MITYLYRTNTTLADVCDKEEALCALDVLEASREEEHDSRKARACIEVTDSGEHHDGLVLTVQAYAEDCPTMEKWQDKAKKNAHLMNSFLDVCHMYMSPRQAQELIEAIQNALSMRKYDDESDDSSRR